jgi:hypothetical protein
MSHWRPATRHDMYATLTAVLQWLMDGWLTSTSWQTPQTHITQQSLKMQVRSQPCPPRSSNSIHRLSGKG